ncbi:RNA-guided endonuclease TnpB family protein [Sporosarcina ureae]|uniref:Transposase n=1 Tax=Sporosarcina ureae TaxID=1571 RepID=A0ABM6JWQ5_SPOUR|nr:RNA-guided endonuclease TnpB family protein [Sporosarcina ureae]ARF14736.1 transposase [Sporosarcina ureae]
MTNRTYVLTLPLRTEPWQEDVLRKRLNIARTLYNACLGELLLRRKNRGRDPRYRSLLTEEPSATRNKAFRELDKAYGLSEYALHAYVKPMQHHFKKNIDSNTAQKIATRAWHSFSKLLFGKSKRVHFKRKGEMHSVEGKSNGAGIRYKERCIHWNGLTLPILLKERDVYAHLALQDRVKYCRVIRRSIRGSERYFVQLVLEGIPPEKKDQKGEPRHSKGVGRVGIDIGTQTIAVVSETDAKLFLLAPNVIHLEREIRLLQRKLDRSRRATNPERYHPNGTIKGVRIPWHESNTYQKVRWQLNELHRKMKAIRKQDHQIMTNWIRAMGDDIRVETMSFSGLQRRSSKTTLNEVTGRICSKRRFGRSLARRAPALLLSILDTKLQADGIHLKKIDTWSVKASQYNHMDDTYQKKTLSDRWNIFGKRHIQRDLYSAFLIQNTNNDLTSIDRNLCNASWSRFCDDHETEMIRLSTSMICIASMGV